MKAAKVVDPASQPSRDVVRFGATVELADEEDNRRILTIVGDDEADLKSGKISFSSPIAKALIGKTEGDEVTIVTPGGKREVEIISVEYV